MTRRCDTCRYWSEMLAQAGGASDGVEAVCLHTSNAGRVQFRPAWFTCPHWADGSLGAIDQPGGNPYEGDPA